MKIGNLLKTIRLQKSLKLNTVAKSVGIAVSTLSQIENEKISPSISSLSDILAYYNMPLSGFFKQLEKEDIIVSYDFGNEELVGKQDGSGIRMKLLASKLEKNVIESYLITLPPNHSIRIRNTEHVENGERFVFIISGDITAEFDNEKYSLTANDSLNYKSHLTCRLINSNHSHSVCIVSGTPYLM